MSAPRTVRARRERAAGRRVLVLGGTSEIALAVVGELQRRSPREVALLGRSEQRLKEAERAMTAAGCERVLTGELDALHTGDHGRVLANAVERLGGVDIVILAVGVLGGQRGLPEHQEDVAGALEVLSVNVLGCGSLLVHAARLLREQRHGALVVLSSAAAVRPRRSNPVYGASKAALDSLAQATADTLRADGVHVLVARPGFVHTRMTRGLRPAPLATTPGVVARAVADGLARGSHTVWAPGALRWAMWAVRLIPRPVFRRLTL